MKGLSATMRQRIGLDRHISGPATWRLLLKKGPLKKGRGITITLLLFVVLMIATFFSSFWINSSSLFPTERIKEEIIVPILSDVPEGTKEDIIITKEKKKIPKRIEIPLVSCSNRNRTQTCPSNYPTEMIETDINNDPSLNPTCPDYFRWIHEDLRPFKATGITRDMVERAKRTADLRVVIVKGKVYVVKYRRSVETRDVITVWGILQLLRRYPGRLPDLELMFDSNDLPVIRSSDHSGPNATAPPPLFRYCGDQMTLDIVFPDWSFWGWAELNIRPWENILEDIKKGNKRIKWMDREPYAYWKGNPSVAATRKNFLTCNVSDKQDWNARLFVQDWILESQQGYKQSDIASQCTYRYKIYVEGRAWSVSEKYILACDSETLLVKPKFYDFFTRSLQPVHHYWPIRDDDKCRSLKFAVDWGNNHQQKAQAIGKAASDLIREDLKMDYVYDYMFHLLSEYANLLKFEPKIPEGAVEVCSEKMVCNAGGLKKKFMMESLVKGPSSTNPCTLPPPYEPQALAAFLNGKTNSIKQVEEWEMRYWENLDKKQ